MTCSVILQFNTEDQRLTEICKRYWELDTEQTFRYTVAQIARELEIRSNQVARLVAQHCIAFSADDTCSTCETPYILSSRSDLQWRQKHKWDWTCDACKRNKAEVEKALRLKAEEELRLRIKERYSSAVVVPIDPLDLSLEQAVYLLSFTRLCAVESFSYATSLEEVRRSLSPTTKMNKEIIEELFNARLIGIHPNSVIHAFADEKLESFYTFKVSWKLPIGYTSENPKDFASELEEILGDCSWSARWCDEAIPLWRKVALNECLQYLMFTLAKHHLEFNAGEKTRLVIDNLLEHFSTSQIYNFIWRAARDAAAFLVRERVLRQHAANTVVSSIQRQGETAIAEAWDIKPFRRNFECPQSMLSEVFFNAVLRIGEDGFNRVPDWRRLSDLPQFKLNAESLMNKGQDSLQP